MNTTKFKNTFPIPSWLIMLAIVGLLAMPAPAHINIRVSIKFILGPNGELPSNGGGWGADGVDLVSHQAVEDNFDFMNDLMDRMGRGYRLQLTEIVEVSGATNFFNANARDGSNKARLELAAISSAESRAQYAYRANAINVYINNTRSGYCSFPDSGNIILVGSRAYNTLILHEIGHFFSLRHTHEGERYLLNSTTPCPAGDCTCPLLIPGTGDEFNDTLPDHTCWNRAQIEANSPGATTEQVDNLWFNIMSYHIPQDRLTPSQWDSWVFTANHSRNFAVSGRTWWVNPSNGCLFPDGTWLCLGLIPTGGPFPNALDGINRASDNDVVLIRGGNYNETFITSSPAEIRATRGDVFIGRP